MNNCETLLAVLIWSLDYMVDKCNVANETCVRRTGKCLDQRPMHLHYFLAMPFSDVRCREFFSEDFGAGGAVWGCKRIIKAELSFCSTSFFLLPVDLPMSTGCFSAPWSISLSFNISGGNAICKGQKKTRPTPGAGRCQFIGTRRIQRQFCHWQTCLRGQRNPRSTLVILGIERHRNHRKAGMWPAHFLEISVSAGMLISVPFRALHRDRWRWPLAILYGEAAMSTRRMAAAANMCVKRSFTVQVP